jgi:hypothetical protein
VPISKSTNPINHASHHQNYPTQEEEQEATTNRKVWLDALASE